MSEINAAPETQCPVNQLKTNRKLWKFILFSIITIGIYPIVFYSGISQNVNVVCSRYDGKKTMHYCLLCFLVGNITFGIGYLVWFSRISNRIGTELKRRGINYSFGAGKYWLWNVLLSCIVVGPYIYIHKLAKAVNLMNKDYNVNG